MTLARSAAIAAVGALVAIGAALTVAALLLDLAGVAFAAGVSPLEVLLAGAAVGVVLAVWFAVLRWSFRLVDRARADLEAEREAEQRDEARRRIAAARARVAGRTRHGGLGELGSPELVPMRDERPRAFGLPIEVDAALPAGVIRLDDRRPA